MTVFLPQLERRLAQTRDSLERGTCNVSSDAKPGPDNELLKKLERCVLCE